MESEKIPQKESISDVLKKYKEATQGQSTSNAPSSVDNIPKAVTASIPKPQQFNPMDFERTMSKETDPDLMTSYEVIKLPSKGMFYQHGISEVNVEYMTSKDEDLLTTPSLIENGTVLDILLKRKVKTPGITAEELLSGDRNAILLFLRISSYGPEYSVMVTDPRTGVQFKSSVNLQKLRYKEVKDLPDQYGYFTVELPMRKKTATIRLLTSGEENHIFRKAQALQEATGEEFSQFTTMKLQAYVVAINEKTDRGYINKFVDVMPALDALTIRRKIIEVSPDVDMSYEFITKDGYSFTAELTVGVDFFFPGT
jgi:hypothetical protein